MNTLLGVDNLGHLSGDGLNGHKSTQEVVLADQGLLHHAVDINLDQLRDVAGGGGLGRRLDVPVTLQFHAHTLGNLGLGLEAMVVGQDHQVVLDSVAIVLPESGNSCRKVALGLQEDGVVLL